MRKLDLLLLFIIVLLAVYFFKDPPQKKSDYEKDLDTQINNIQNEQLYDER